MVIEHLFPNSANEMEQIMALLGEREESGVGAWVMKHPSNQRGSVGFYETSGV